MTDPKNKNKPEEQDQSMEEILQSIRRIIAEDGDEIPDSPKPAPAVPVGSDILELTDVVKDDGSVENLQSKQTAPLPQSVPQKSSSADVLMDIDNVLSAPEPQGVSTEGLLSQETAMAAAAALKNVKAVPPRTAAPAPRVDSPIFRSGTTVEDLVLESLRPMLKEWLDTNLKTIVEQLVQKEIKRIVALNSES